MMSLGKKLIIKTFAINSCFGLSGGGDVSTLPHSPRGAPLMFGDLDSEIQTWVRRTRIAGGVMNVRTLKAGAEAVITRHARHRLKKYGGHVEITDDVCRSILRRMGFVKRCGTKGVKQLPQDFDDIKAAFVEKVNNVFTKNAIPDALVINWDQTGVNMVPGGAWTMEEQGSQQVPIHGMDDKRQITVLLAVTKSGVLLPPQVIYAGKTDRCLPKDVFPVDWDVTCTETHWSNETSMVQFIDKVVVSYVNRVREGLPLSQCDQQAVAIFDVYKSHQSPSVISKLKENGITPLFVQACCTDRLQPLDLTVNRSYKELLKQRFHDWYTAQLLETMDGDAEEFTVDLKTSTIKPVHAQWLVSTHQEIGTRRDVIRCGFEKAGLL